MCSIIWNIIQCTISRITWCALSFEILYNVQCSISRITWCALSFEILYNVQFHV